LNLIVTCARHLEDEAREEINGMLEKFGDSEPSTAISKMPGILTVSTKLDSIQIIKKIHEMILDEPWSVRYCLRIIPIQVTVETTLTEIEKGVQSLSSKINNDETYRISIEKRNSNISSQDLIEKIASKIKNKVSLENPDKIILIEILGGKTGLSVLKNSNILSVEKLKRSISE